MNLAKARRSRTFRALTAAATTAALTGGAFIALATSAYADTTPPWVATEQSENEEAGTVSFYDATGNQISSGALDTPLAAFAVASGGLPGASVAANGVAVYMASPQLGEPANFFEDTISAPAAVPYLGTLPTSLTTLQNSGHLVVPVQLGYNDYAQDEDPSTYPSWTTTYEVRIQGSDVSTWYSADVQVDTGTNTWTLVYPTVLTPTTTTLGNTPNPSAVGQNVTLTATVTPDDVPGSVQFKDGSTNLGAAVAVAAGQAQTTVSFATGGTHTLHAVFTPTDTGTFDTSTGDATQTVNADNSSLTISGSTTIKYGASTTTSTTLKDTTTNTAIASASVKLQRKSGANWVTVATVNTSATGKASKSVKPTAKITYRWSYAGNATHRAANSTSQVVSVAPVISGHSTKASVALNVAFKIYGTVEPASSGQKVTLQRQSGRKWVSAGSATIKKQKLPNGTTTVGFVFTVKQRSKGTYHYRVSKAATTTLVAGTSNVLTVHIT